jgi:small subunit ribosomal protein S8
MFQRVGAARETTRREKVKLVESRLLRGTIVSVTDPIADMLTRIRNALGVEHDTVLVPASNMKVSLAQILKEEGFIKDYERIRGGVQDTLKIHLRYDDDGRSIITSLKRVSKPGLRVYTGRKEVPRVYGGLGISILSTSKGVMTGQKAWRGKIGGEILCYVW